MWLDITSVPSPSGEGDAREMNVSRRRLFTMGLEVVHRGQNRDLVERAKRPFRRLMGVSRWLFGEEGRKRGMADGILSQSGYRIPLS